MKINIDILNLNKYLRDDNYDNYENKEREKEKKYRNKILNYSYLIVNGLYLLQHFDLLI